jgi:outer membrane cobalamin receptor
VAALKLEAPFGPVKLTARGIYEHHRNDYRDPGGWVPINETHKIDTYGAELHVEKTLNGHSFLVGGDYYLDDLDSTNIGNEDQEHGAVFGQYQTDLLTNLTLLLGLRYDIHSDFGNELSPRAALHASLTDSTRLRLSVNKAFRAPTLNDLYWPNDLFSMGNPGLEPETAWEYELALEQSIGDRGRVTLAGFLRDADDLISWQPDEFFVYSPVNVNEARIWGVEVDGRYDLCSFVTIGGNYTYLHPKDRDTDEYLLGKPRHEAHGFVALTPFKETSLRFDGRYLRYYPEIARKDKDYFVADLALTHAIMFGEVAVDATVSIKNLFNEGYEANPGYPMPPRELFAGLTAYF